MAASADITRSLQPFVRESDGPVRALAASAEREGDAAFRFLYRLDADFNAVCLPARRSPRQVDELWRHTCFEAFIACPSQGSEYVELNFSPTTEWAAYSFESHRKGMTPLVLHAAPDIEVTRSGSQLVVGARVASQGLLPERWRASGASLRIALSAVIEDERGHLSYWALMHAPDKPDFHHAAGFILEV